MADKSWFEKFNEGVAQVGQVWGTYTDAKKKVEGIKKTPADLSGKPAPSAYPAPSGVFSFGGGAYGGFSGLQLALVGGLVIGLVAIVKLTRK